MYPFLFKSKQKYYPTFRKTIARLYLIKCTKHVWLTTPAYVRTYMVLNYEQFLLIGSHSGLNGLREIIVSFFKLICRVIQLPGKAIITVITAFCRHIAKKATWNWSETNETFATCLVHTFCSDGAALRCQPAVAMAVPHYAAVQRALVLRT